MKDVKMFTIAYVEILNFDNHLCQEIQDWKY